MISNLLIRRLPILATFISFAAFAGAQADPAMTARIIDEGKNHNQVMKHLRELTNIGSRLTSSPRLAKAEDWAMKKFKSFGLTNVHLDKWGEYPVGFDRGTKSFGRMTAPQRIDFEITSQSWTEGTHGTKKGPAMYAPLTMADFDLMKKRMKGAWLIYKQSPPRGPRPPRPGEPAPEVTPEQKAQNDLRDAIAKSGALGVVYPSRNELVVTGGNYRDKTFENHPMDVQVMVRKSDMDKIMAGLDQNMPVQLEFNLDQKFVKGPISNYNVVADIKGTEKPDEIVIVSGHLDSWDGPGSQGALDNGTGSCTAIEAARILMAAGAKPKRTIRFILWTGEEQGLFGSAGYVRDHRDELPKISAVLVDDGGTNYQGGYIGLQSQKEIFESAFAPVVAAFPDMPQTYTGGEHQQRPVGSDQDTFNRYGVPGFFTNETGRSNYGFVHHTQHDRYEMAIPEYLVQSSTNHAAVSYFIACYPTMLPRDASVTPPPAGK